MSYYIKRANQWLEVFQEAGKTWCWPRRPSKAATDIRSHIMPDELPDLPTQPGGPPSEFIEEPKNANGTHAQPSPDKHVDGKFVDMTINDEYVVICGWKIERKKEWNVDVKTWRMQMEFLKKKLAARGPMSTANMQGSIDTMDQFRRLVEWEP